MSRWRECWEWEVALALVPLSSTVATRRCCRTTGGSPITFEPAQRAIEALLADRERLGGVLTEDHVARVLDRRGLRGEELQTVMDELVAIGFEIASDDDEPLRERESELESGTFGARTSLAQFLSDAGRYPLLYAEEEVRLGRRIRLAEDRAGTDRLGRLEGQIRRDPIVESGLKARDSLINSNLRLVVSIARPRASHSKLDLLDLIQEGCVGLMRAVDKFDHTLGYKFSTYATWWIRQAVDRALADKGRTVRIPVHQHDSALRLGAIEHSLRLENAGKEPTLSEVAIAMECDPAHVQFLREIRRSAASLDKTVRRDEDMTLGDLLPDESAKGPEDAMLDESMHREIEAALSLLTDRQRDVIESRFGLVTGTKRTLEEIADDYGVTRERIRQIETVALRRIRTPRTAQHLSEYLWDGADAEAVLSAWYDEEEQA